MSISTIAKRLIFKQPAAAMIEDQPVPKDTRQVANPYLSGRRTWNDHVGFVMSSRQTWQFVGLMSLLIALASVGGLVVISSQSKLVPYVIEVDKLGQARAAGQVTASSKADPRVVKATVSSFIEGARLVTPDAALQRKAVFHVYSFLSPNDPATPKMNEWLNGSPESSPFVRAAKEIVNIEITSILPQTPDSWEVDWKETTRDRQGVVKNEPVNMRAILTVYTSEISPQTTEEQLINNPLGIYVKDFYWSSIQ